MKGATTETRRLECRSFSLALYLMANGHRPIAAARTEDAGRTVVWLFPPEARRHYQQFQADKDALNALVPERD